MIYDALKKPLLAFLDAPPGPPPPPAGSSTGSVQIFRASRRFLYQRLSLLGFWFLVAVLVQVAMLVPAIVDDRVGEAAAVIATLIFTILGALSQYFLTRLEYDLRYYIVTDRSLRIRHGVMLINESTFTYANIQNISIQQSPIERIFGIKNLRIETAGGAPANRGNAQVGGNAHNGVLAGIDNAEVVRDRILALLKAYRDAGLGDHDDASIPAPATTTAAAGTAANQDAVLQHLELIRDELHATRPLIANTRLP